MSTIQIIRRWITSVNIFYDASYRLCHLGRQWSHIITPALSSYWGQKIIRGQGHTKGFFMKPTINFGISVQNEFINEVYHA